MHDAVDIRLRVRGNEYPDIVRATWTRSMEQVNDLLELDMGEKWFLRGQEKALPFRKFDPCEFVVDDRVVLTGYITGVPRSGGEDGRSMRVMASSKVWAPARASYTAERRQWVDATVMQIARDVMRPFGINVTTDVLQIDDEPFARHGANLGETAWAVLHKALRARGLWARSKANGDIEIIEADDLPYSTPLVGADVPGQEATILSSDFPDAAEEFSEYLVVGQSGRRKDWANNQAAHGWAKVVDPSVGIHCPLLISEPSMSKQRELEYRANYEFGARAGMARRWSCIVQGIYWDKQLIETNRIFSVVDPRIDVEGNMLLVSVSTSFDAEGTLSALELSPPEAFMRESPPTRTRNTPVKRRREAARW